MESTLGIRNGIPPKFSLSSTKQRGTSLATQELSNANTAFRLLAVNGVSLGLAIIANMSLLLNMARRLSFSIAQPITIIGWYLSSVLLIADLASIIHIVKVPGQRRALTQVSYTRYHIYN